YIKRLLGLPGELIAIFLGRIYSFRHTGPGAPDGITEEEWRKLTDVSQVDPLKVWEWDHLPKDFDAPAQKLWKLSKQAEKQGKKGAFQIERKPPKAMLALSRPVFDNDHQPKDLVGVLPERWAPESGAAWSADNAKGFKATEPAKTENWLRYHHFLRPDRW